MGGSSSQTTQSSTTAPWTAAQPTLNGILGQLNGYMANGTANLNGAQTGAINTITNNGTAANQFTPQINGVTSNLLNGGGALGQSGNVQNGFNAYQQQTNPLASNTNYDPMSTPGLATQLQGLNNSILTNVNGQFAAAGRDGSPANAQAAAYGLAQGEAPLITQQYNQNVQNQQAAAGNLYNAGNTTANTLAGYQNQFNTNQLGGVSNVSNGLNAQNAGSQATLGAQTLGQQLPLQNLGLLANIGVPIAGLGSQSTGTSNTQNQLSPIQMLSGLGGALGSTNPATGAGSGIMGLLGML